MNFPNSQQPTHLPQHQLLRVTLRKLRRLTCLLLLPQLSKRNSCSNKEKKKAHLMTNPCHQPQAAGLSSTPRYPWTPSTQIIQRWTVSLRLTKRLRRVWLRCSWSHCWHCTNRSTWCRSRVTPAHQRCQKAMILQWMITLLLMIRWPMTRIRNSYTEY